MYDLAKLSTLKQKLVEEEDFSVIMTYFFDHFADDPTFIMTAGQRARNPKLEALIPSVASTAMGKEVRSSQLMLNRIPSHKFVHGGGIVEGRLITFFYFEEIDTGLLAVAMSTAGNMCLARFRAGMVQPMKKSGSPTVN